jgi:DsbC/DsbD-like thiol-disulfide interchange protein
MVVSEEVKIVMRLALMLLVLSATAAWSEGAAPVSSDWVKGFSNQVRLIAGHATRDGKAGLYAGVEIEMPPGWDTYWRSPGDAGGVAPEFEWEGSKNLASARVLYPAPRRIPTKAGDVAGYVNRVVFPIALSVTHSDKPVVLRAKVSYGVCKDICVPAAAELQVTIPPGAGASGALTAALAHVPRSEARPGLDPTLAGWHLERTKSDAKLVFTVATSSANGVDAFVVAPDGIYAPLPKRLSVAPGKAVFEVKLTEVADFKDWLGKPLTVTLVDDKGQSDTKITLK